MFVTGIKIHDFRNHEELSLDFSPFLNCFIGNNAVGKTNILEAIYFLSTLASFRAAKDEDLIRWGKEVFSLSAGVRTEVAQFELQTIYGKIKKSYKINGIKKEKSADFVGQVKTVFFSPEDLSLVKGGPQNRRKFLDHLLEQLFPSYHHYLLKYRKLIKQKNIYLKELKLKKTTDTTLLDVYDEQIAHIAAWITLKRLNILKKLLPVAKEIHAKINNQEELYFNYQSCIPLDTGALTLENIFKLYQQATLEHRKEEIMRCMSLIGPQRDDICIYVNKKSLKDFGSQGQQRTALVAFKLAQAVIFRTELDENPIILLDDIFSELDENRRNNILSMIKKDMQVFITATDIELIPEEYKKEAKIYYLVNNGKTTLVK